MDGLARLARNLYPQSTLEKKFDMTRAGFSECFIAESAPLQ